MIGVHNRNVLPMLCSTRCGARTRSGGSCRSPAVSGKMRCRMHGGAPGSGAPLGNKNALKHGRFTRGKRPNVGAFAQYCRKRVSYLLI